MLVKRYHAHPIVSDFLFTTKANFNHEILVDLMHLSDGDVLHVICTSTKYQLGNFCQNKMAKEAWSASGYAG